MSASTLRVSRSQDCSRSSVCVVFSTSRTYTQWRCTVRVLPLPTPPPPSSQIPSSPPFFPPPPLHTHTHFPLPTHTPLFLTRVLVFLGASEMKRATIVLWICPRAEGWSLTLATERGAGWKSSVWLIKFLPWWSSWTLRVQRTLWRDTCPEHADFCVSNVVLVDTWSRLLALRCEYQTHMQQLDLQCLFKEWR